MYQLERKRREAEGLVETFERRRRVAAKYEVVRSTSKGDGGSDGNTCLRRNASMLSARGQGFAKGLLAKQALPRATAISSRIPLVWSPAGKASAGKCALTAHAAAAGTEEGRSRPAMQLSQGSLSSRSLEQSAAVVERAGAGGAGASSPARLHQHSSPTRACSVVDLTKRTPTMLGTSPQDAEWRRSAAAAARAVLTLSGVEGVDGAAPSRSLFPPGAGSGAKRTAFSTLQGVPSYARGSSPGRAAMPSAVAHSPSCAVLPSAVGERLAGHRASKGCFYLASDTAGLSGSNSFASLPLAGEGIGGVRAPATLAEPP